MCGQTPDSEYQLILIFSLFLFCFVLFIGSSLASFVCPMSSCSLCPGCGAFLAWCHPFPSCLPPLPAGSPWVVWAAYNARLQGMGQSSYWHPPLHRLRSSSLSGWFLSSLPPLQNSLALILAFSLSLPLLLHVFFFSKLLSTSPLLIFLFPLHFFLFLLLFSSSHLFHIFCHPSFLFLPPVFPFLTTPLLSPCPLLPPPSFCMNECSHFCMDTGLVLLALALALPAGNRAWGN